MVLGGRRRGRGGPWALIGALVAGSVLGLVLRLALFAGCIMLLPLVSGVLAFVLSHVLFVDPVYTRAAADSLTNLHIEAVALAGPPGDWLHDRIPGVFAPSARTHWALARVVLASGSPVLGRLLAAGVTHAGVLAVGLIVVRHGWLHRRWTWIALGCAIQSQVALAILGSQPSVRDLEATGISFAVNALAPWLRMRGTAITDGLTGTTPALVAAVLVSLALLIAYTPATLVLLARKHGRGLTLATAVGVVLSSAACAGALGAGGAAASQVTGMDVPAPVAVVPMAVAPAPVVVSGASVASVPASRSVAVRDRWYAESAAAGPSEVQVVGSNARFQYLVNGVPQVIQGMGLNTQYSSQLSPGDRAARIEADMTEMSALGINTVLGWDPAEFDNVLLDAAQRHGIGVIVPFDLDPNADYTDPAVRADLHAQVMDWVARYKDHPALRMWGLGNEVLHKIVHPAWVGPQDPERERNAEAFSDWLIATADDIHAADPHHPVTYRSAEDAFVDWIIGAVQRRGGGARPWFVFGTNCYQKYLSDIVDNWPDSGLPVALWVSEFAPGGMAVPDRPDGFAQMWGYVRRHPDWVLGGAVYAWTRNGPEGVDRTFGLTDDGVPVEAAQLAVLGSLFGES